SATTVPPVTFAVSNTPSPTVKPWSNTDTFASSSASTLPSIQTAIGTSLSKWSGQQSVRAPPSVGRRPRRNREQVRCFQLGLLPLQQRIRPPGDTSAGTEPQLSTFSPEGADTDRELALPSLRVDPADRTAVREGELAVGIRSFWREGG